MIETLTKTKDKTLSFLLEKSVSFYIKEFGEIISFELNSINRSIYLKIDLKGELEHIELEVIDYKILEEGYITFKEIKSSREWINILASAHLNSLKIEIPKEYIKYLKVIL